MYPAFCWLLSISPLLLSWFKLQKPSPRQKVECRPLNSCTTALGFCADRMIMAGGSKADPGSTVVSSQHKGQTSLPFTVILSLPSQHLHCQVLVGMRSSLGSPSLSVRGCKQDSFAQGFSRRASLGLALKIYNGSCEPVDKWPDCARGISERLKHLKCRCSKDTYICH